jgi:hypothetical protein
MKILTVSTVLLLLALSLVNTTIAAPLYQIPQKTFELLPTNTPTPKILLKIIPTLKIGPLVPLVSSTPILTAAPAVVTIIVTPTAGEVKPTENTENQVTNAATPAANVQKTNNNSPVWFMAITIGALVIIVLVQALPKKKTPIKEE